MRIDGGGASNYVPVPAAQQTYTAQASDSVSSVAQKYQVTPEELARTNGISVTSELKPNQVLILPQNAVQPAKDDAPAPVQTPAQKTDAAIAAYNAAVAARDNTMRNLPPSAGLRQEMSSTITAANTAVDQAKTAMDQAIDAEIGGQVAHCNAGTPAEFRTPSSQLIDQFGQAILQRHQGDAAKQSAISASINDYRVKTSADALIPSFSGDWSAADKLKQIMLQGQPPEVVAAVLADPRVQDWINQAAKDIDQPYQGSQPQEADWNVDKATQAAGHLQSAIDGLPPELATAVTEASLPTIRKISQLQANGWGSQVPFDTVHGVLTSLGDSPQAQSVIDQVAGYYAKNFAAVSRLTAGGATSPLANTIESVYGNANPAFAIALARQLQASDPAAAKDALNAAEGGLEQFQGRLKQDLSDYAGMTQDLNWLVKNTRSAMTPDQMNKAIDSYVTSKGPQWQQQFEATQNRIVTDARALAGGMAQLKNLPGDLKQLVPDLGQRLDKHIGGNGDTRKALEFAISKDPGMFEGAQGETLAQALISVGQVDKGFMDSLTKAYVARHFLPAVKDLNPNDPASYAKAQQALNELRGKAQMFGISQRELDEEVDKLDNLVNDLKTESLPDAKEGKGIHAIGKVQQDLVQIGNQPFDTGATGVAFRTMAFGLSGLALINAAKQTGQDPSLKNDLNTLALAINTGQDTIDFAKTLKLIDADGSLAQWGASGIAGGLAGRFANALYGVYYAKDLVDNWGNVPEVALDATGLAGSFAAALGGDAEAGSLAGPVGAGLVVLATAGLFLVQTGQAQSQHTSEAAQFMAGGNVNADVAKALSGDAMGGAQAVQNGLKLSSSDLQALAHAHPDIFKNPPITTQAFVDLVQACGMQGTDVNGFADALAKDNPGFIDHYVSLRMADNGTQPLTHKANLVDDVIHGYPQAKAYLQAHQPGLVSADGQMRRQADRDFELALSSGGESAQQIGNLLQGQGNSAYQVEIISDLKQHSSLDGWVRNIRQDPINGWPQAARNAIQLAANAHVLSADEASRYLSQLG